MHTTLNVQLYLHHIKFDTVLPGNYFARIFVTEARDTYSITTPQLQLEKRIKPNKGILMQSNQVRNSNFHNNKIPLLSTKMEQTLEIFVYKLKIQTQDLIKSFLSLKVTVELIHEKQSVENKVGEFKYSFQSTKLTLRKLATLKFQSSSHHLSMQFLFKTFVSAIQLNANQSTYYKTAKSNLLETQRFLVSELSPRQNWETIAHTKTKKNKIQIISYQNLKEIENRIRCLDAKINFIFLNQNYLFTAEELGSTEKEEVRGIGEHGYYERKTEFLHPKITTSYQQSHLLNHNIRNKDIHLIVLVHGLKGNSLDMKKIKEALQKNTQETRLFIFSKSNQMKTHKNLEAQGKNLAEEIDLYLKQFDLDITRISFIGHSLGGLVIRATLPYLSKYANKMYTFITLSTPHLGFYQNSNLLKIGIKLFLDLRNSDSLKQLLFEDEQQIQDSFLFKLADQEGLNWFKNIVLFSSSQDKFIPVGSARIEKENISNNSKKTAYDTMITNLLKNLTADDISRVSIDFKIDENSLDNLIGRTAHLKFLQDAVFIKNFVHIINNIWK